MARLSRGLWVATLALVASGLSVGAQEQARPGVIYKQDPMPPGFSVVVTELEGPVFAAPNGKTVYRWPTRSLRSGDAGELKGKPTCDSTVYRENAGLMSPYPGGLLLPNADSRPSCVDVWPPVVAPDNAAPVGKWTVLERKDGARQWAYDGFALYTSVLDHGPGDVLGGMAQRGGDKRGATREPVTAPHNFPSQFDVAYTPRGLMLLTKSRYSVYSHDKDGPNRSNCDSDCLGERWTPVLAPEIATPGVNTGGNWSIVTHPSGVKQWAFRGKPLYTHNLDEEDVSQVGDDVLGWDNVYVHTVSSPPRGFTYQDTRAGQVLADARGKTIYIYYCTEDSVDQLSCDHPGAPQEYRFAVCGRGDPAFCVQNFPYVLATAADKSESRLWSIMHIDPSTGRRADAGASGTLRVWAYRERPVYLCARDQKPGDIECDSWGEFNGERNGFLSFWLRQDYP